MMKPTVIIAAAAPPRAQVQSIVSKTKSAGMVTVNGKPIIGWILENLIEQKFEDFLVLIPENDQQFKNYINHRYKKAQTIEMLEVEDSEAPKGLAHSLFEGLRQLKEKGKSDNNDQVFRMLKDRTFEHGIFLILGHTICRIEELTREDFFVNDFVIYDEISSEESRWCYINIGSSEMDLDNKYFVTSFIDKPITPVPNKKALIGMYFFHDVTFLYNNLDTILKTKPDAFLSQALSEYIKKNMVKAIQAPENKWFDCGNVMGLCKTRESMIDSREHNPILIDAAKGIICKRNRNTADLLDEFMWYLALPKELLTLIPHAIKFDHKKENAEFAQFSLEYFGYPTLSEAWVYDHWHIDIWRWIIEKLINITRALREYKGNLDLENYKTIYWEKTQKRITKLQEQNDPVNSLLNQKRVIINGVEHYGWIELQSQVEPLINDLFIHEHSTIVHGDFHFGNIFFDVYSGLVKLIDPRGNFGSSGIYGDCKYDLAKLRHSIASGYNFISNDLYDFKRFKENEIKFTLPYTEDHKKIVQEFDQKILDEGFVLEQIKLIEGLLFISMLPLHKDHHDRQNAQFIRAIMILNEVVHPDKKRIIKENFSKLYLV